MKQVTLDDVAAEAGVSRQTVSRAINGTGSIRASTLERVMAAVEKLGYRPNLQARGLVTRRTNTIGLVVGDITNPFFPDVARGVQDVAEARNHNVFVCNFGGPDENEIAALKVLATQGVDGIIFFSDFNQDTDQLRAFADTYSPLVLINGEFDHPSITTVEADLAAGGAAVAEHLLGSGRTRLGVITAVPSSPELQPRMKAFRDRAAALGHPIPDDRVVYGGNDLEGGVAAARELFNRDPDIDGLFAYNDLMAIGALRVMQERGWAVPGNCALVGCDDLDICAMLSPDLSSVHMDRYGLGAAAMEHLFERMEDEEAEVPPVRLGSKLIVRGSSAPMQT